MEETNETRVFDHELAGTKRWTNKSPHLHPKKAEKSSKHNKSRTYKLPAIQGQASEALFGEICYVATFGHGGFAVKTHRRMPRPNSNHRWPHGREVRARQQAPSRLARFFSQHYLACRLHFHRGWRPAEAAVLRTKKAKTALYRPCRFCYTPQPFLEPVAMSAMRCSASLASKRGRVSIPSLFLSVFHAIPFFSLQSKYCRKFIAVGYLRQCCGRLWHDQMERHISHGHRAAAHQQRHRYGRQPH